MTSLLSENADVVTTSTESSPRKQLHHVGHGSTDALLGWIGFHAGASEPICDLRQLDDGTVLLRLVDTLTGFTESDKLRPTCVSVDGPIASSIYVSSPTSATSSAVSSPVSSYHSSAPSSPEKRQRKVKIIGGTDGKEMSRFQKLANIEIFMQWLNTSKSSPFHGVSKTTDEINIRGVAALDILEADKKLVPGLLWSLFWEFVLCPSKISKNKQEILWLWVLNTIASFENKTPKQIETEINFRPESWSDNGGLTKRLAISLHTIPPESNASVSEIFEIMHKTRKIPPFLKADDLSDGSVDEWSIIAYYSCWFDVFNNDKVREQGEEKEPRDGEEDSGKATLKEAVSSKSKGEFSEFFGPNILNKASAIAQHDYDMPLKLRIETFLVISARIVSVKNKFLARLEKLLLEIVNLLGQFAEYESYDYGEAAHTYSSGSSRTSEDYKPEDLRFKGTDLHELEKQMLNTTTEDNGGLSETLRQAINSISFVSNFRTSTRQKVYEQFIELEMYQCKLSDMLRVYGLQHFKEPPEKSLNKISKFIDLLKKSEKAVYSNANDFIEKNIEELEKLFYENHKRLSNAFALVEGDIIHSSEISDFDDRIRELENIKCDIPGLKEFHLRTVSLLHELEMINSSLARGFDRQSYKSIINEQRYKLCFLEDCIDKSMKSMTVLRTQKNEASEVLKIAKIAQQYENSKELHDLSEDKRQLKTHLLVHTLIQRRFQFKKNIDPIQVLFDRHDTGSKGYLTKSEFKKAFLVAYPDTATLVGVNEVDTIFETSYETLGKMRRGIEFPQFKAVIELGNSKGSDCANMDDFAAALLDDSSAEGNETTSINTTGSNIDRLLHQIEHEKMPVDLTNNIFYNSFAEVSGNKDTIDLKDLDKIHLHPMLRDNLQIVFPDYNYREWFQHVDQSSIYQDNEDAEDTDVPFGSHHREIALKNVLYDLEKVDLSKI